MVEIHILIQADLKVEPNDNINILKQDVINEINNSISKIQGDERTKEHNIFSYIENLRHEIYFKKESE